MQRAINVINLFLIVQLMMLGIPITAESVTLNSSEKWMAKSQPYTSLQMNGMIIHPTDPFQMSFMVGSGDEQLTSQQINDMVSKQVQYFMAALAIPDHQMWVNLSPYESSRILPQQLSQTELGMDMLQQDYLLKQLSSSLMSPETDVGQQFWDQVLQKSSANIDQDNFELSTFNKIWIVPDYANIHVYDQQVYISQSKLKVMLEDDYLAYTSKSKRMDQNGEMISQEDQKTLTNIVKDVIIPVIEQEVNDGKVFANLRQIYHVLILANWYKRNLNETFLSQSYSDKGNIQNVKYNDVSFKQTIYDQYIQDFSNGVYDVIYQSYDPASQSMISRMYTSGGLSFQTHKPFSEEEVQFTQMSTIDQLIFPSTELSLFKSLLDYIIEITNSDNQTINEILNSYSHKDVISLSDSDFDNFWKTDSVKNLINLYVLKFDPKARVFARKNVTTAIHILKDQIKSKSRDGRMRIEFVSTDDRNRLDFFLRYFPQLKQSAENEIISEDQQQIANQYDDRPLSGLSGVFDYSILQNLDKIETYEGLKVLSLGIGMGTIERDLQNKKGMWVVGVDVSQQSAEEAQGNNIPVIVSDAQTVLTFADKESFDIIYMPDIIGYLDLQKTLIESLRVVRSGGLVYIKTPTNVSQQFGNYILYGKTQMSLIAKQLGFEIVSSANGSDTLEIVLKKGQSTVGGIDMTSEVFNISESKTDVIFPEDFPVFEPNNILMSVQDIIHTNSSQWTVNVNLQR